MMKNEIVAEVWRNRDAFARRHKYDVDSMVTALQKMEHHVVSRENPVSERRKTAVSFVHPR
ncbi:MAG TPA: hypothetical protein PLI09_04530 [Candidatus Hydrogenedentes bacterium]|nr:hypothetical protein [Candidatus Hydrogenedentota bacterium]